jgi:dihydroorotase
VIDAIATDHAPHPGSEKMQEFERCPFGIIGLETAIALSLDRLFHTGKANLSQFVSWFTVNPARILRLPGGTLATGSPADLTLFSLDAEWIYDVNKSPSKSRNTPFHGRKFKGGPYATIVAGNIIWRGGDFV